MIFHLLKQPENCTQQSIKNIQIVYNSIADSHRKQHPKTTIMQ